MATASFPSPKLIDGNNIKKETDELINPFHPSPVANKSTNKLIEPKDIKKEVKHERSSSLASTSLAAISGKSKSKKKRKKAARALKRNLNQQYSENFELQSTADASFMSCSRNFTNFPEMQNRSFTPMNGPNNKNNNNGWLREENCNSEPMNGPNNNNYNNNGWFPQENRNFGPNNGPNNNFGPNNGPNNNFGPNNGPNNNFGPNNGPNNNFGPNNGPNNNFGPNNGPNNNFGPNNNGWFPESNGNFGPMNEYNNCNNGRFPESNGNGPNNYNNGSCNNRNYAKTKAHNNNHSFPKENRNFAKRNPNNNGSSPKGNKNFSTTNLTNNKSVPKATTKVGNESVPKATTKVGNESVPKATTNVGNNKSSPITATNVDKSKNSPTATTNVGNNKSSPKAATNVDNNQSYPKSRTNVSNNKNFNVPEGKQVPPDNSNKLYKHVYIVSADPFNPTWTLDQMKIIQTCLLNKITELRNGFIKPKFNTFYFYQGWISIGCADQFTIDWLKSVLQTLKPWTHAQLCLIEPDSTESKVFMGHFTLEEAPSTEYILNLIQGQNNINAKNWKVMNRQQRHKTVQLTFCIDSASAEILHANNYRVHFGFGEALIKPVNV